MAFEKVILEGNLVRLEPLASHHREALCDAIRDGELWTLFVTLVPHPKDIDAFFEQAEKNFVAGDGLAFAIIDKSLNKVVGSTRFMKAELSHKRAEIGFTFLGKSAQKTLINTEAKYLLLQHAFEHLALNRVELITDCLNFVSQKAILRIGAREEGIMRNHMIMRDGRIRDSVLYSIVKHEWPGVKQNLLAKLCR